jgi:CRISPR-associated endoribonuclease Cas6
MRIILKCSASKQVVPYDHIPNLTGAVHKWIGTHNNIHGEVSLYSFSWLQGGKSGKVGLSFSEGAHWFISSYDPNLIKTIINGIQQDPEIGFGIAVRDVTIMDDPDFSEQSRFLLASPILIKRRDGERTEHVLFDHPLAGQYLTETMVTKLKKAGLDAAGLNIDFDKSYHSPKTKLVNYKGIKNRASFCPVIIKGTAEQQVFAWNVGIGNSTGIGFGALK